MARDNKRRRMQRARRKQLYQQLKLQADLLCESHDDTKQEGIILAHMMNVILSMTSQKGLNDATRQALANHFTECANAGDPTIELGGPFDRDSLYLNGSFRISDLARRIVWSETGPSTIEQTN